MTMNSDKLVLRATAKILRPLMRLLLSEKVPFGVLMELLKRLYIESAEQHFVIPGRRQTDSRIHMLTGIHRRDVARIRALSDDSTNGLPEIFLLGSRVVSHWLSDEEYTNSRHQPLHLPYKTDDESPSFERLVYTVNQNVQCRTVLDELLHSGVIDRDKRGKLFLKQNAYMPNEDFDERVLIFAAAVRDHMAAGVRNLIDDDTQPLFERSMHNGRLSQEGVEVIMDTASQNGDKLLRELHRESLKKSHRAKNSDEARHLRVGVYVYTE